MVNILEVKLNYSSIYYSLGLVVGFYFKFALPSSPGANPDFYLQKKEPKKLLSKIKFYVIKSPFQDI